MKKKKRRTYDLIPIYKVNFRHGQYQKICFAKHIISFPFSLCVWMCVFQSVCFHLVSGNICFFLLLLDHESLLPILIQPLTMVKFYENTFIVLGVNTSNDLLSSTPFVAPHQAGPSGVASQPSNLQPPPPARVQNHPQLPQSDCEFDFVIPKILKTDPCFESWLWHGQHQKYLFAKRGIPSAPSFTLSFSLSVCLSVCKDTSNRRRHCQSREKAEDKQFE